MKFFAAAAISLLLVDAMNAEKPFDFASTPGKLPKQVVPREYAVRIIPDIDKLTFAGEETVKIDVRAPVRQLILNALEIQIASASIDGRALPQSAIKLDPKQETATLDLGAELPAGQHTLVLKFSGKINQQGQGLFYCRYQEQGSGAKKIMLGTQLEATDARRFFPCWDEPSFRARFQLTAVVPENWLAVSNMPIESETKIDNKKEVRFAATPPMSSYLNVFVAGELDLVESRSGNTQLRVITTKGKSELGRYALEASAQILQYYNEYFGVAYPLPKLDQIAIPGGFGGAMENWGGITYYESVLLFDPKNSTERTKQIIYEVLAHEMAHQWFGDLVTMAWWDNLWLNEGFASWMGTKCTAHFNPQWEVWLEKSLQRLPTRRTGIAKEVAMEGDARSTAHPIQQPIASEAEANSAFDDITYKKGQSFLRMLESFLGEEVFRDGLRKYMAAHKLSNTTTADLWSALAEASGKPIVDIAAAWTEQPGFPIVNVKREREKFSLTQERFTVHFPNPSPSLWKIPLTYSMAGDSTPHSLLMTEKTAELPNVPADRAIKINIDGTGNYRVQYDDQSWQLLAAQLPKLSEADRVNLLGDAWALVQAGRKPFSFYLDLVSAVQKSGAADFAQTEQIINTFDFVNRLLVNDPQRGAFQKYARATLRPSFDRLGWIPRQNESPKDSALRASLVQILGELNDDEIVAGCRQRFEKFIVDPGSLPPDLRPSVFAIVGRNADAATWKKLHELGMKTTSIEAKQHYYDALGFSLDPKLAQQTLQISLGEELPTSRAIYLVARVARQSDRPEIAWDFAKAHMKELLGKADALAINNYAPSLFVFFSDPARIDELRAYAKSNLPPAAEKEVEKAADEIGFRAELKPRISAELAARK